MKFIDKYYSEDKFRSKPYGTWCPFELGYEDAPKEKNKCPKAVGTCSCRECWNREMPEPKLEPANANDFPGFEINDVVQLRSGRLCIVLPNNRYRPDFDVYIFDAVPGFEEALLKHINNAKEYRMKRDGARK